MSRRVVATTVRAAGPSPDQPAPDRRAHIVARHVASSNREAEGGEDARARSLARVAAAALHTPSKLAVLDEGDLGWIAEALDHVEHAQGQPWRVAFEAIDGMPIAKRNIVAVRSGIARAVGGAKKLTAMARRVRETVLGKPALGAAARAARIATAAAQLGVANDEIDGLLFMDLPGERTVVLEHGRPSELEVAAFANVALIQRALRRAHRVKVWLWDDDGTLLRAALSRGLLVTASRDASGATLLEIVGPLALCQRTAVYGRALGQLVPLLSASTRFALELETSQWRSRLESPTLLPLAPIDRRGTYEPTKLAHAIGRVDPTLQIFVGPAPLVTATAILCPDLELLVRGERWLIELVGFWTTEHLTHRLAAYAEAGVERVIFCIDEARGCADDEAPIPAPNVLRYMRRIKAEEVIALLAPEPLQLRNSG